MEKRFKVLIGVGIALIVVNVFFGFLWDIRTSVFQQIVFFPSVIFAIIILIIVFKEQMKSMKMAIITAVVILVVNQMLLLLGRNYNDIVYIYSDNMIKLFIISVVSVVFSPIATFIICGLDLLLDLIIVKVSTEGGWYEEVFALYTFLLTCIYGLILSFWAKWYKLKEKKITIKTLSVFMAVQVVALIIPPFFISLNDYEGLVFFRFEGFSSLLLGSVLMAMPLIMLTCIVLRKPLAINIPIKKSTLRIIGRVALLLVVMGFFMPIGCNQNGFQIAEYGMNIDKSIGAMTGSTSGVGVWLYVLFFVSLIGGLMIIPLVMKKKIHIGIDWVSLIIPIVCVIVLLSKLKDITGGSLGDLKLQIGGNVIIIGLIVSLLTVIIASFIPEKESGQLESPPVEST